MKNLSLTTFKWYHHWHTYCIKMPKKIFRILVPCYERLILVHLLITVNHSICTTAALIISFQMEEKYILLKTYILYQNAAFHITQDCYNQFHKHRCTDRSIHKIELKQMNYSKYLCTKAT